MYTLTTLNLALADMLDKRLDDLHKAKAGIFYEPMLKDHLAAMQRLPTELAAGTPLADELDALDDEHDRYGKLIRLITEATLCDPGADSDLKASAQRIQDGFIPELVELMAAYAVEARRAKERKPLLTTLEADLKRFPIAGAQGRTLLDVAKSFIQKGEEIDTGLSKRADIIQKNRKQATAIRSATIGTTNRFRMELVRELKRDPTLPQDLEARIFGYLDTLDRMATPAGVKPAPAPTGTTGMGKTPEQ